MWPPIGVNRLIDHWLSRRRLDDPAFINAQIPKHMRLYAVGDIHGRSDLLRKLHKWITSDALSFNNRAKRKIIIYLGDYIDRGIYSSDVIDLLTHEPLGGFHAIYLKGNHEDCFLEFLRDSSIGPAWFSMGGAATVLSYNVEVPNDVLGSAKYEQIRQQLLHNMSRRHLDFFSSLRLCFQIGDYYFAHAGVRPGIALNKQAPKDLIWIRDEFTRSRAYHGKIIVHGHSLSKEPQIYPNRICIDTGAYATNRLTCLILDHGERRFYST